MSEQIIKLDDWWKCEEDEILLSIPRPDNIEKMKKSEAEPILKKWAEERKAKQRRLVTLFVAYAEFGLDKEGIEKAQQSIVEAEKVNANWVDDIINVSSNLLHYLETGKNE